MSAVGDAAGPRGRYAFLRTRRWVRLTALLVAASVACALLGVWQWGRFTDRHAEAEQVSAAYDADPVPLEEALRSPTGPVRADEQWQPVELRGRYLDGGTVLLRNRPVEGTPAVHVVAPFVARTDDGEVLVAVDRGWVPAQVADGGGTVPQPPDGEVTLTARLRTAEAAHERVPPAGQVYTLAPAQVLDAVGGVTDLGAVADLPVLDGYVIAAAEDPEAAGAVGGYGRPGSKHAMNISYAFQWWVFSAGMLVALVVLARREAAERSGHGPVRRVGRAEFDEDLEVYTQLRAHAALPSGPTSPREVTSSPGRHANIDALPGARDVTAGPRVIEAADPGSMTADPGAADRAARSPQAPPSSPHLER
ncbi:SURF1 family protein [Georgenia sp. EYE_87]|uniref:SURF1 family cytochrome oxidase biogenesis protein n=1 Tax=Georgenia sp. EYE_87 TaxID=2853448 RepID=UPI0020059BEB|nr:SURF1 family protein [Georgenia sp. EYE_87]MCK6212171.1 SURF1 family protein [Georgenia sp. EYE_87]